MIKKTCDRCGETINDNPNGNVIIPTFMISRFGGIPLRWESVDLCPECSRKFDSWLKNENCSKAERKEE